MAIAKIRSSKFKTLVRTPGWHNDGGLLYLQVTHAVGGGFNASWVFRYRDATPTQSRRTGRLRKQTHYIGLGPYHTVDHHQAREQAAALRLAIREGKDPMVERQRLRAIPTFTRMLEIYFEQHPHRKKQWQGSLNLHAVPVIGHMPVNTITEEHVLEILKPLWLVHTEVAVKLRGRLEAVLAMATFKKYRSGQNVAQWKGFLDQALPKPDAVKTVNNFAAMPYDEVPAFIAKLRKLNTTEALALEFAILTVPRSGDILGQDTDEGEDEKPPIQFTHIQPQRDVGGRLAWMVPSPKGRRDQQAGDRTKQFRTALSDRAIDILAICRQRNPGAGRYVFRSSRNSPGRKGEAPMGKNAMRELLQRLDGNGYTVHGFRTSFRTWAADSGLASSDTGFMVAETVMKHKAPGSKASRVYQGDWLVERLPMVEAWAAFCSAETKVVPLRKKKAA